MSQIDILSKKALHVLPRLRVGLTFLLVAILGLLSARLLWLLVEPGGAVSHPLRLPTTTAAASVNSTLASADLTLLTRSSRFGTQAPGGDIIPDAPATSLNLTLKGVRSVASDTREPTSRQVPTAIILTPDGRALTYHPGDAIIEGVTLDRVLQDRVLIRKSGALETLVMDSSSDSLAVLSRAGESGLIEGAPRPATISQSPAAIVTRSLLASVDIAPVYLDGVLTGYRITSPRSPSDLSGTGLQPGDLVTRVEGRPVGEIDIQSFTERLSNSTELSMTVQRNGASVPVTLRFPEGE
ncbi:type II secretion system protein N [Hyphomonas sp.]|uniref:type II secretion system protein N n=1 Tax=Hyphomonas sp. TaxID=87 RepID=UPI0032EE7CCD